MISKGEPFLSRVQIRNYKSIGKCDVELGRLTLLVGRNGAGKSNFLDALRFVVDGLQTSLDHAVKARSGIQAVRRKSSGHPRNFAIQLQFNLPDYRVSRYGIEVGARSEGGFALKHEQLEILSASGEIAASYRTDQGKLTQSSSNTMPPVVADRLYLVVASGLPEFRPAYDALTSMGFYNLNPDTMKELQSPDAGDLLHRDGGNITSVIERLKAESPEAKERIESFLSRIVDGVVSIDRLALGPRETIEFRQQVGGSTHPWRFPAANMSDGTLRALGVLVAVSQLAQPHSQMRLVGIEEPETALHPAAAGALMDALCEASVSTQVLVTTHSADLLEATDPQGAMLLAVQAIAGETRIAPLDQASQDAIRNHLYSAGELLRMDQLEPDPRDLERQSQARLFDFGEEDDQ